MSLYLDASALLKLCVDEPDSDACEALLATDPVWVAAEHTLVEVRRNLARLLDGVELAEAKEARRLELPTKELLRLIYERKIRYVMINGIAHVPEDALEEYRGRAAS